MERFKYYNYYNNYMEKEKEIFEFIKKEGEVVFSRICGVLGINKYYAERYLDSLIKENKIESFKKGNYTYYKVKKK